MSHKRTTIKSMGDIFKVNDEIGCSLSAVINGMHTGASLLCHVHGRCRDSQFILRHEFRARVIQIYTGSDSVEGVLTKEAIYAKMGNIRNDSFKPGTLMFKSVIPDQLSDTFPPRKSLVSSRWKPDRLDNISDAIMDYLSDIAGDDDLGLMPLWKSICTTSIGDIIKGALMIIKQILDALSTVPFNIIKNLVLVVMAIYQTWDEIGKKHFSDLRLVMEDARDQDEADMHYRHAQGEFMNDINALFVKIMEIPGNSVSMSDVKAVQQYTRQVIAVMEKGKIVETRTIPCAYFNTRAGCLYGDNVRVHEHMFVISSVDTSTSSFVKMHNNCCRLLLS